MIEEWVKKARNDAKNEVYLHLKIEKALGAAKEENKELLSKADYRGEGKKEC